MLRKYTEFLAQPDVARLFFVAMLSRMPFVPLNVTCPVRSHAR